MKVFRCFFLLSVLCRSANTEASPEDTGEDGLARMQVKLMEQPSPSHDDATQQGQRKTSRVGRPTLPNNRVINKGMQARKHHFQIGPYPGMNLRKPGKSKKSSKKYKMKSSIKPQKSKMDKKKHATTGQKQKTKGKGEYDRYSKGEASPKMSPKGKGISTNGKGMSAKGKGMTMHMNDRSKGKLPVLLTKEFRISS